jgi:CelD/BcsL family acetyltransferase involved in cellulose biosynthesis
VADPAAPKAPPQGWREGTRELRFTFGEFKLGTARFRAWTAEPHSLRGPEALETLPPFSAVPGDVSVLAIQSLPVSATLPTLARRPDALRYVVAHFNHYSIEIEGTFEDYLARLSGKSRHEMARKVRRFETHAAGKHELREYRTPAEIPEFLQRASALSKATYQERLLDVGLPDDPGFAKELAAAASRDDVRGYILSIGGAPVAYGYSPGIFLLNGMLKRIHAENRFRVFDFGSGDAQYKRSYATTSRQCATVLQFRRTARNALIISGHRALTAVSDACVRLLKTLGVKDRLKRLLRRAPRASEKGG